MAKASEDELHRLSDWNQTEYWKEQAQRHREESRRLSLELDALQDPSRQPTLSALNGQTQELPPEVTLELQQLRQTVHELQQMVHGSGGTPYGQPESQLSPHRPVVEVHLEPENRVLNEAKAQVFMLAWGGVNPSTEPQNLQRAGVNTSEQPRVRCQRGRSHWAGEQLLAHSKGQWTATVRQGTHT